MLSSQTTDEEEILVKSLIIRMKITLFKSKLFFVLKACVAYAGSITTFYNQHKHAIDVSNLKIPKTRITRGTNSNVQTFQMH